MELELLDRARAGDEAAFHELVGPYRRELQLHRYRILGALADAEDALQETMLAAWQGLHRFEGRSSLRTWLYRIATTRALNLLRADRPHLAVTVPPNVDPPEPTRLGDVVWLQPYPDVLLEDFSASPEGRYEAREAVSLAFVTALQLLPPLQQAALESRSFDPARLRQPHVWPSSAALSSWDARLARAAMPSSPLPLGVAPGCPSEVPSPLAVEVSWLGGLRMGSGEMNSGVAGLYWRAPRLVSLVVVSVVPPR